VESFQIAVRLKDEFQEDVLSIREYRGQVSVIIKKDNVFNICKFLHDEPDMSFDYLVDLCGVDNLRHPERKADTPRFEVVYHLYSHKYKYFLRLKALVPEEDCTIDSVVPIWAGANWHERECLDMFGIVFKGHPDPRRILMPEDWEGYPLRKDYPTKGPAPESEWKGFKEVLDTAKRNKEFEWER